MEKYAYGICFVNQQLQLRLAVSKNESKVNEKTIHWLTDVFFPKFVNWVTNDRGSIPTVMSLSHVCIKMYSHLYSQLKEKYAKSLMNVSL